MNETNETLNDILANFKCSNYDQETAAAMITDLFKRQPVNYSKTMNPADDKHREA